MFALSLLITALFSRPCWVDLVIFGPRSIQRHHGSAAEGKGLIGTLRSQEDGWLRPRVCLGRWGGKRSKLFCSFDLSQPTSVWQPHRDLQLWRRSLVSVACLARSAPKPLHDLDRRHKRRPFFHLDAVRCRMTLSYSLVGLLPHSVPLVSGHEPTPSTQVAVSTFWGFPAQTWISVPFGAAERREFVLPHDCMPFIYVPSFWRYIPLCARGERGREGKIFRNSSRASQLEPDDLHRCYSGERVTQLPVPSFSSRNKRNAG
ncbi:hypothetical protein LX36DRAFT_285603 [Colletotrichum falcatum]|nr:hypothetical protein LX36DRAFT_285603 [Colletotrichum falcatum]